MKHLFVLMSLLVVVGVSVAEPPRWSGNGACRILVKIDPRDIGGRSADEMPAQVMLDFKSMLAQQGISEEVDLSSLQVHKYDPKTGEAEAFQPFDGSRTPFDRPCRFEDDAVPDDYPDSVTRASAAPTGRGRTIVRLRGGRLFNREMDNSRGKLTFTHTQTGSAPSHYAIYWDVRKTATECGPSPAPWIGDADVLRQREGGPLGGLAHFNVGVGDFNGDGLFDFVAGAEKGDLMWFPNRGTPTQPRFVGCRMLQDDNGPIDLGWYGSPVLFDWNNDGLIDLLAGTSHTVIVWWKNVGTKQEPKLTYAGFVQADAGRLEVPAKPVAEDHSNIFKTDYYNQPWVGDWDGDGVPDILTGGYVTGQIFFFKSTGRSADGTPTLKYVGPIEADGKVLDTVWSAAPFAYDLDGDGDKDLLTGSWFWSGIHRPMEPGEVEYIMSYRNVGTAEKPVLQRDQFAGTGEFPNGNIARPSVVDWNGDGLPDLLVSDSGGNVRVWINEGKPNAPSWRIDTGTLSLPWAFVRGGGYTSLGGAGADGVREVQVGQSFMAFEGSPHTPQRIGRGRMSVDGQPIDHPGPGYGDPYGYETMADWDGDGHFDLLYGTHQGEIYLHRNLPDKGPHDFAPGEKLTLITGEAIRVGPEPVKSADEAKDFTVLQGSRIVLNSADFDGDGINDLAVTETFGNMWIYLNTKKGGADTLAPPVNIGKVFGASRSNDLGIVDWNEDGKPDLMLGTPVAKPGTIYINQSTPGQVKFDAPAQPFELPFMFWGPKFKPIDWNKDGDEDFLVFSEFYSFFVEKSYLLRGYPTAVPLGEVEKRQ